MKNLLRQMAPLMAVAVLAVCCLSCKSSSESFTAKAWHNMNSRYNSYFLARENIKAVEKELFDKRVDNYNRILDVYPSMDTNAFKAYDVKMQDVIKKSSNIPNRHDNSRWLDPAYVLIGKARFYLREFDNAISTLKYVNTRGDVQDARNRALIELMKIYIFQEDYRSARAVFQALRKRKLSKSEKLDYLLTRAHFFRKQSDYLETGKSLGSALKRMPGGEKKGRIHFLQGQIYQYYNRDKQAYQNYKAVLKNNPPYELAFNARLGMAQVSDLKDESDTRKIDRYFKKLLQDEKNLEYQDKIYYEKARFERRRGEQERAIANLKQSLLTSTGNPTQKAYSYLELGEIYFDEVQEYELAKTYYDSAITGLPQNIDNYELIKKRQENLADFVKYLNVYRDQDSLQTLSKKLENMDSTQQILYLEYVLTIEETENQKRLDSLEALQRAQEQQARLNNQNTTENPFGLGNAAGGWYFYNPTSLQKGREAFIEKWKGLRPLADNWRRSDKIRGVKFEEEALNPTAGLKPEDLRKQQIAARVETRKQEILDAIPKTPEEFEASTVLMQEALFELGKIFQFQFDEPEKAVPYLEELVQDYPRSENEPEVLYQLYLIHTDANRESDAQKVVNLLRERYPSSSYYKRIINPNWLEEATANEAAVKKAYSEAYHYYEVGRYQDAQTKMQALRREYPDNLMEDKLTMLSYLIDARINDDNSKLKTDLEKFKTDFPQSELIELADALIRQIKE